MPQKKATKRTVNAKLAVAAELVSEGAKSELENVGEIVSSTTNGNVENASEKQATVSIAFKDGRGRKKRKGIADDAEIENAISEQQPSTSAVSVNENSANEASGETNSPVPAKRGRKKAVVAVTKNAVEEKAVPKPLEKGRKKNIKEPLTNNTPIEEEIVEKSAPKKRGRKPAAVATEIEEETEEVSLPIENNKIITKKAPKKRAAAAAAAIKAVADEITPPSPKSPKATTILKKTKKELKNKSSSLSPSASPQKLPKGQSKKAGKSEPKAKKNNAFDGGKSSKEKIIRRSKFPIKEENEDEEGDEREQEKEEDSKKSSKKNKKIPLNSVNTIYNKIDFELNSTENGVEYNLKISSWNVAGLRSWIKKDGLIFLDYELPDIFCIQETKCTTDLMPEEAARIPGYHPYWLCMPGGYAGVAIYSKIMPINVEYGIGDPEHDVAGRIITAEYEKFYLVCVYVPNSGRKLVNLESRMRWEMTFKKFIKNLNDKKPVIICGDMNVSHQEIDLANPKSNTRSAGFTKEEREQFTKLLSLGFVDTFRHLYPNRKGAYTYWTYMSNARSRNIGWRLDYFLVSERLVKRVVDNCIRFQVMGSDHCPITLFLKL